MRNTLSPEQQESRNNADDLRQYNYHRGVIATASRLLLSEQIGTNGIDGTPITRVTKKDIPPAGYDRILRRANFSRVGLNIAPEDIQAMSEVNAIQEVHAGKLTPVQLIHITCHDPSKNCWIAANDTDYAGGGFINYGERVVIRSNNDDYYTRTPSGATVDNAYTFGAHQVFALKTIAEATQSDIKEMGIVFATGTGKSFVILSPAVATGKGGIFSVPKDNNIDQFIGDILALDRDATRKDIATSSDIPYGHETSFLLNSARGKAPRYIVIKHEDLARFANADPADAYISEPHRYNDLSPDAIEKIIAGIYIGVDEVHESDLSSLAKLLKRGNKVLGLTATWTPELEELFGEPLAYLDMHYAMNELKAFRPLTTNVIEFPKDYKLDDVVFEIMADYFGTTAYITSDNSSQSDSIYITPDKIKTRPHLLDDGHAGLIDRMMATNEVTRHDKINMAFTKNGELLEMLAAAYQGVFDGTYPRLDQLAQRATEMRTKTRVQEMWKLEHQVFGGSEPPTEIDLRDPGIQRRFKTLIEKSKINQHQLQEEAQKSLRSKTADVITRQAMQILFDTKSHVVRQEQVFGLLHKKLAAFSTPDSAQAPLRIALSHQEGSMYQRLSDLLSPLKDEEKRRILSDVLEGTITSLIIDEKSIDLSKITDAKYTALVMPGDEKGARATSHRLNKGWHVHAIGDSDLATGYSNPDVFSVQRCIFEVISEGIIRGTQMGGRAARGKDRLGWLSDYLIGKNVSLNGDLGAIGGRPFLSEDVLSANYRALVEQYRTNFSNSQLTPA